MGGVVSADEPVVELETDKVTIEVPAPCAGILSDLGNKAIPSVGSRRRHQVGPPGQRRLPGRGAKARAAAARVQANRLRSAARSEWQWRAAPRLPAKLMTENGLGNGDVNGTGTARC